MKTTRVAWIGAPAVIAALLLAPGPAPAQPGGGPVTLAFKYRPGATSRYRVKASEGAMVKFKGVPGGGPRIPPLVADLNLEITQKVESVTPAGTANLRVMVNELKATTVSMDGQEVGIRSTGGKVTATVAGQPATVIPGGLEEIKVATRDGISMQATPQGTIRRVKTPLGSMIGGLPGADLTAAFGGFGFSGLTLAALPDHPVSVDDTWEEKRVAPGPEGDVTIQFQSTLKALSGAPGHRVATIETTGTAAWEAPAPPAPMPMPVLFQRQPAVNLDLKLTRLEQDFEGKSHFEVDQGSMKDGGADVDIRITIGLKGTLPGRPGSDPQGGGQPGGTVTVPAIEGIVDGKIGLQIASLPPAPAPKPAPPRRPRR